MAMKRYRSVDQYFEELELWQPELERLRELIQRTDLVETLKWSFPCYTHQGTNVVGLGAFKSYFGIWFFQGSLMEDPDGVMINAQEGKTKGMRQWRMSSAKEIKVRQVQKYLKLAIAVAESGAKVPVSRNRPITIDPLLAAAFAEHRGVHAKFKQMRPGCQREYADYVNEAKRDETKLRRIAKILPMIEAGGGLNDRYRK